MADSSGLTAPIGGGKSMWMVIQMCKTLEKTDRGIVTNTPVILQIATNPERLRSLAELLREGRKRWKRKDEELYWSFQEYAQAFIERPVRVGDRMIYLPHESAFEFFRYLPTFGMTLDESIMQEHKIEWFHHTDPSGEKTCVGYKLPLRTIQRTAEWNDQFVDFSQRGYGGIFCGRPVDYFMDEAHKLYGVRDWQRTGKMVEDYQSELRKLDDNLWVATQHPEKLDKNMRRNMTEWWHVQNMSKTVMFMGVTFNKRFRYHWYNQADLPSRHDSPTESGWFRIDDKRRYQWLYRTMSGSSITGGMPGVSAEEHRRKGKHPIVWVFFLIVVVLAAWFLPRFLQKSVQEIVSRGIRGVSKGFSDGVRGGLGSDSTATNAVRPVPVTNLPAIPPASSQVPQRVFPTSQNLNSDLPKVVGTAPNGTNVWVFLSDGSIAKSEFGEVLGIGRLGVRLIQYTETLRWSSASVGAEAIRSSAFRPEFSEPPGRPAFPVFPRRQ